ncbi:MAG TPA: integrase core domain-containing protein [Solirubrobacteraceae bacterium]|nr:integrase core domain-containing protein [Solirubrobacteraceae bacterium]
MAPTRRNRVWQTDFSELKITLACPVTSTKTWREALAALKDARSAAEDLLERPLIDDLINPDTGEIVPIVIVTDNGPCYRAAGFARYIASRDEFTHVRTRHRSPETDGVIERFYQSIKYEHLYRHEIQDGPHLSDHVEQYREIYNHRRPHEALGMEFPINRYTSAPDQENTADTTPKTKESVSQA